MFVRRYVSFVGPSWDLIGRDFGYFLVSSVVIFVGTVCVCYLVSSFPFVRCDFGSDRMFGSVVA